MKFDAITIKSTIGKNIKLMRRLKSEEQIELAKKLKMTRQTLAKIEGGGNVNYEISNLLAIAEYFEVSPVLLFLTPEIIQNIMDTIKSKENEKTMKFPEGMISRLSSINSGSSMDILRLSEDEIEKVFPFNDNDKFNIVFFAILFAQFKNKDSIKLGLNLGKMFSEMKDI